MIHSVEGISRGSPLLGGRQYSERAHDLARFEPDPLDDALEAFVNETSQADIQSAARILGALTDTDFYTLLLFARREAVRALRTRDKTLAITSVAALTLVNQERIDYRDLSPHFPLWTVGELGASIESVIAWAIERSTTGTARAFEALRPRAARLSLADCALIEVHTAHGLGVMDSMTGKTSGYDPTTHLAESAVDLSDRIDREGTYVTRGLALARLPRIWFTTEWTHGDLQTDGCVSIDCGRRGSAPWSHALLVFVAMASTSEKAAQLARRTRDSSTDRRPRVALSSQNRLALFIGGSVTTGEAALENAESLERFCRLAAPGTWPE